MGIPLLFNIQKYSIHDGEGIRTTVFFKGCPLSCSWCHNPESQRFEAELLFHADRCTGCGACSQACPQKAVSMESLPPPDPALPGKFLPRLDRSLCQGCGACVPACPYGAREAAGKEYPLPELIRLLEKDWMFYERSGGGITLSGGEPLAQDMDYIEELARRLHASGYSVDIDTCGHVPYEHIRRVLPYVDTFLYDIKLIDPQAHLEHTGVDNRLILENLKALSADGGKIQIRLPLIDGVNATEKHLTDIISFLQDNAINPYRINLLKYHSTGSGKYARLDRLYGGASMGSPDAQWLHQAEQLFRQSGFQNIQTGG
nr:glycyl-radical enzyme activating protein [uncultured Acetatifactor sp.]